MDERHWSQRALATKADLAASTINRLLRGHPADPETLEKLAKLLNEPLDHLYRLAGILPEQDRHQEIVRVIEHLVTRLPENDQQEILEIIRMKIDRQQKGSSGG